MRQWKALFRSKGIEDMAEELQAHAKAGTGLKRSLTTFDLTFFGIAAILGAGIFSTIGNAATEGGPAIIFLFLLTSIACVFCALCYAQFASIVPISGSAYTYAYASFGELIAWIIGWDLLMEYAIGDIAIAISWSQYLTGLLAGYGIHIPPYFTMDMLSAYRGFHHVDDLLQSGMSWAQIQTQGLEPIVAKGYAAWSQAPQLLGFHLVLDLPALAVTALITWVVFIGIEDSKRFSQVLVLLKIAVVLFVIIVGATYIRPENWSPFAPNGVRGVLKGVSAVFFAYIGFDALSTTAEECKNPQRDLPRGMIYALGICTLLYMALALVLTGVVHYKKLGVGDPLAFIFGPEGANLPWAAGMIAATAVVALSTVLLVFQLGQTRIWMTMSRDGLLPAFFSRIHPKYKTPWISTILAGVLVAVPSLFLNLTEVTDLNSIGTLFAFILVCGGTLRIKPEETDKIKYPNRFRIPYINSKYTFPFILLAILFGLFYFKDPTFDFHLLLQPRWAPNFAFLDWMTIKENIPLMVFLVEMAVLSFFCYTKNLSLIPVLGLSSCSYLITELGITNWIRFGTWLLVGLLIYFLYGFKRSKLATKF